ncbi:MAG: response regulator [Candidatus Margulisiibacteriota bacterium]
MKILIADDEEVIRSSLETILTKSGHDVIFALEGEEALNKARTSGCELVLLDLDMPKINGYDVLKQLRSTHPELPVIFITGTGEAQKIMQSIAQYKLNGFIEKPFTPEQVIDIVNKATQKKSEE